MSKDSESAKLAVDAKKLTKRYGAVEALCGVDFQIGAGEIVGFAGDNGAGKSTLMKIIAGDVTPTSGEVAIDGHAVSGLTPALARQHGVEMVYQDLALCDNLNICANIFLGHELVAKSRFGFPYLDHTRMHSHALELLNRLEIRFSTLLEPVTALSGGQRQMVAIARAIAFKPKLVIMDEPTAALSVGTGKPVLELIRRLSSHGIAVMLVSHRLSDLLSTSDRIYVVRRGNLAAELKTKDATEERLLHLMAGVG